MVSHYLAERNPALVTLSVRLVLLKDQTIATRQTVKTIENNALFGVFLVPMSFISVVISVVVALAGIAVNDAIVLISTANSYLAEGVSVARAIVSAARRLPILITSLTIIAGLLSLAIGLAGESLI